MVRRRLEGGHTIIRLKFLQGCLHPAYKKHHFSLGRVRGRAMTSTSGGLGRVDEVYDNSQISTVLYGKESSGRLGMRSPGHRVLIQVMVPPVMSRTCGGGARCGVPRETSERTARLGPPSPGPADALWGASKYLASARKARASQPPAECPTCQIYPRCEPRNACWSLQG